VVYLGHRYGSAVVVRKDGPIKTFADMRGRTIAIPSRFSDERLLLFRAMKVWGINPANQDAGNGATRCFQCPAAHAIDAFVMGEPFPFASGNGLAMTGSFFSPEGLLAGTTCHAFLVVPQHLIDKRPNVVQVLGGCIASVRSLGQ